MKRYLVLLDNEGEARITSQIDDRQTSLDLDTLVGPSRMPWLGGVVIARWSRDGFFDWNLVIDHDKTWLWRRLGRECIGVTLATDERSQRQQIGRFFDFLSKFAPEVCHKLDAEFKASAYGDEWEDDLFLALVDEMSDITPVGSLFYRNDDGKFGYWKEEK